MIKRNITETIYEYDKEGVLVKKTVTETHEEDDETRYPQTITTWPPNVTVTPLTNKGPQDLTPHLNDYYYTQAYGTDRNTISQSDKISVSTTTAQN